MIRIVRGTVHGKTIQLEEDLGVAEGQEVKVQVDIGPPPKRWGDGIRRSAGGWADYPEMDAIMDEIYRQRRGA
jgi:hypothetical protein